MFLTSSLNLLQSLVTRNVSAALFSAVPLPRECVLNHQPFVMSHDALTPPSSKVVALLYRKRPQSTSEGRDLEWLYASTGLKSLVLLRDLYCFCKLHWTLWGNTGTRGWWADLQRWVMSSLSAKLLVFQELNKTRINVRADCVVPALQLGKSVLQRQTLVKKTKKQKTTQRTVGEANTTPLTACVLQHLKCLSREWEVRAAGGRRLGRLESTQWENMLVSEFLCATSCYTYSTSRGRGWGRGRPHMRSVSYPMRPAQLQTDRTNRQTTHFFFLVFSGQTQQTSTSAERGCSKTTARSTTAPTWHHTRLLIKQNKTHKQASKQTWHWPLTLHLLRAWTASSWNRGCSWTSWCLYTEKGRYD